MPDGLQRLLGLGGLILAAPLLAVLGLAIRLDSPGPVIFPATRLGSDGRPFRCFKLRTMTWSPEGHGLGLTVGRDPRVTRFGRLLRRGRLDELPQLLNVVRGEMRLVGPRPEDPRYADPDDPLHRFVFSAKPGMTGLAQLLHVDEATRLEGSDPERYYAERILPEKLAIDAAYLKLRSPSLDLWILRQTPRAVLGRPISLPDAVVAEVRKATSGESPADHASAIQGRAVRE